MELLRRDVHVDFELVGVYCCLCESRLTARDLSPRQHHWNTLLYLDMLIVNVSRPGLHKGPATRNDIVDDARADAIFATLKSIVDDIVMRGAFSQRLDRVTDDRRFKFQCATSNLWQFCLPHFANVFRKRR